MTIFVGSSNPVKINAVKHAAQGHWQDVRVIGIEVTSGINEQPLSDEETQQGAINRARAVLKAGIAQEHPSKDEEILGVGLEGGVFIKPNGEMWSTVWGAVIDKTNQTYCANGARIKVDEIIASKIRSGGEMGPVVAQVVKTGESNIKQKQGMMGIVTKEFVTRTEEYTGIAKLALGIWYGRSWAADLDLTSP